MLFKTSKKKTNGARHKLLILKTNLIKFKPLFITLNKPVNKTFNKYRYDDKTLNPLLQPGTIIGKDKDNFRTNFLFLIKFLNGAYMYLPASFKLNINQIIFFNNYNKYKLLSIGNITTLKYLQPGDTIHNVTSNQTRKTAYARAAGTSATVLMQDNKNSTYVKLPSSEIKLLLNSNKAIIGRADNLIHKFENFGKAGYKKFFGLKPVVRGVAQNAVDHPHGGRTKGGIPKHSP
jgi:large subunit ribosomal protein L2